MTEAGNITDNVDNRYAVYAKAQAILQDNAVLIPTTSLGGTPSLTRLVPFSGAYGLTGNKGSSGSVLPTLKYTDIQDKPVTAKEYEAAKAKWLKAKEESNDKYQKALADHVEK